MRTLQMVGLPSIPGLVAASLPSVPLAPCDFSSAWSVFLLGSWVSTNSKRQTPQWEKPENIRYHKGRGVWRAF